MKKQSDQMSDEEKGQPQQRYSGIIFIELDAFEFVDEVSRRRFKIVAIIFRINLIEKTKRVVMINISSRQISITAKSFSHDGFVITVIHFLSEQKKCH